MLAGRLTGTLDGRPVVIDAGEGGLLVSLSSFRSAWVARKTVPAILPLLGLLRHDGISLRLRIAGIVSVELLPKASLAARLFAPALSRLG